MIIKELFEGPVGDYCIARNIITCLFKIILRLKYISKLVLEYFRSYCFVLFKFIFQPNFLFEKYFQ